MTDVLTKLIEEEMRSIEGNLAAAQADAAREARLGFEREPFDPGEYLSNQINSFARNCGLDGLEFNPNKRVQGDDISPYAELENQVWVIHPYAVFRFKAQEEPTRETILSVDDVIAALEGGEMRRYTANSRRYTANSEGGDKIISFNAVVTTRTYEEVKVVDVPRRFLGLVPLGVRTFDKRTERKAPAGLVATYRKIGDEVSDAQLRVKLGLWRDENYRRAAGALAGLFGYDLLREATPARNSV